MRLIDIEPILRMKFPLLVMLDKILSAPTIDIVTCAECKRFGEDSVGTYCDRYKCTMMPNDFCSYGCKVSEIPTGQEGE